jgi:AP-1 complex subunit mu
MALTCTAAANAMTIFLFLYKLVAVFQEYFKNLEEESIRDNFVIIYELLDEMMDYGYPQFTEPTLLQEYIIQEGHKLNRLGSRYSQKAPLGSTHSVPWRPDGIVYKKNEVFLDVVEKVNLFLTAEGNILDAEILGCIVMRCDLSGMPELRLGLNDKLLSN